MGEAISTTRQLRRGGGGGQDADSITEAEVLIINESRKIPELLRAVRGIPETPKEIESVRNQEAEKNEM